MSNTSSPKVSKKQNGGSSKSGSTAKTNNVRFKSRTDETYLMNRNGQEQWAKEMKDVTETNPAEVAVLLFSWEVDEHQSMNTTKELNGLQDVFENKYNFKVHKRLLSTHKPQQPRYQLNSIFNDFLSEHDRPGNLLIVYYGGHGIPSENDGELRLLKGNPDESNRSSTELTWNDVEPALYRISANLLLVFDCCHAGLVARGKRAWPASRSHFEFIGSTAFDQPARGPKSRGSFTRAMIESLHGFAEEDGFTSKALVRRIMDSEAFRGASQQPLVHECGKRNSFRELKIAPTKRQSADVSAPEQTPEETVNFYLHLKYVFREKPSQEHYRALAERLNDLVKNDRLPVAAVVWEGLSEYNPRMSMADAARMLKARLGHRLCKQPAGRLEISASTQKPSALLQRTLTTLTMDNGVLTEDQQPDVESSDLRASSQRGRRAHFYHQVATLPFFFKPAPIYRTSRTALCLAILLLSAVITLSRCSHSFWTWLARWTS